MTTRKRSEDVLRALCAEVFEGDGVSPSRDRERSDRSRGPNRKDLALCKQVSRAVQAALQTEIADPLLRDLVVSHVEPDPDASRVRVYIQPSPRAVEAGAAAVLAALARANGVLRTAVAGAIARKRVPTLVFSLTGEPRGEVSANE